MRFFFLIPSTFEEKRMINRSEYEGFDESDFIEYSVELSGENVALLNDMIEENEVEAESLILGERVIIRGTKQWESQQSMLSLIPERNLTSQLRSTLNSSGSSADLSMCYLSPERINEELDRFTTRYSTTSKVSTRIFSLNHKTSPFNYNGVKVESGTPRCVHVAKKDSMGKLPGVLVIGGTHGDEFVSPVAVLNLMESLIKDYVGNKNGVFDFCEIYVVPVLNIGGLDYSYKTGIPHRKNVNMRYSKPNKDSIGVDPNRNYPIYFGYSGSAIEATVNWFCGPYPFSEAETLNIHDLVKEHPNIVMGLDCHAGEKEAIYRPVSGKMIGIQNGVKSFTKLIPDIYDWLYKLIDKDIEKALSSLGLGNLYALNSSDDYAGTSDEFFLHGVGILGYSIELSETKSPVLDNDFLVRNILGFNTAVLAMLEATSKYDLHEKIKRMPINSN